MLPCLTLGYNRVVLSARIVVDADGQGILFQSLSWLVGFEDVDIGMAVNGGGMRCGSLFLTFS